jgi:hypothetical protein
MEAKSELAPFTGEEMNCILCGKVEMSDPAVESGWRAIEINKRLKYCCPDHFPADPATEEEYGEAYYKFIQKVMAMGFHDLDV